MNLQELKFLSHFDETFLQSVSEKMQIYKALLKKFNGVHNLSHFKDVDKEIIDSLKVLDFVDFSLAKNIVDVGSGAGFPAVFLAFFEKANFHLFEPNAKKSAFLRSVKIECELSNLHIYKEKIQDFSEPFFADIITSRALMKTKDLIKLCENFTDKNTLFVLYKGSELEKELEGLKNYQIYTQGFRKYCVVRN